MKTIKKDLNSKTLKEDTEMQRVEKDEEVKNSRRNAVQKLLAGTGVVTLGSQLEPTNWLKPAVNAVILPSHAQTSVVVNTNATISGVVGTGPTSSVLDYFISASYAGNDIGGDLLSGSCIAFEVVDGMVQCSVSLAGGEVLEGQTLFTGSAIDFSVDGDGLTAMVSAEFDSEIPPTSASGTVSLDGQSQNFTAEEGAVCTPVVSTTTMTPDTTSAPG